MSPGFPELPVAIKRRKLLYKKLLKLLGRYGKLQDVTEVTRTDQGTGWYGSYWGVVASYGKLPKLQRRHRKLRIVAEVTRALREVTGSYRTYGSYYGVISNYGVLTCACYGNFGQLREVTGSYKLRDVTGGYRKSR